MEGGDSLLRRHLKDAAAVDLALQAHEAAPLPLPDERLADNFVLFHLHTGVLETCSESALALHCSLFLELASLTADIDEHYVLGE